MQMSTRQATLGALSESTNKFEVLEPLEKESVGTTGH